jgi:hypothetical protein
MNTNVFTWNNDLLYEYFKLNEDNIELINNTKIDGSYKN